jgi:hypothetical protein
MLTNATLTRIDRRQPQDAAGEVSWAEGPALTTVGAEVAPITVRQRISLGAIVDNCNALVIVYMDPLTRAGENAPQKGDRLQMTVQKIGPQTFEVVEIASNVGGSLSHWELFSKQV